YLREVRGRLAPAAALSSGLAERCRPRRPPAAGEDGDRGGIRERAGLGLEGSADLPDAGLLAVPPPADGIPDLPAASPERGPLARAQEPRLPSGAGRLPLARLPEVRPGGHRRRTAGHHLV